MLSIIIPVYNQRKYTKQLLEQIPLCTVSDFEIIVIDSASTDETPQEIKNYNIRYIRPDKNLFVNGAWNLGVKEANGEYVCIMNNDIVLTQGRDKPLIDNLKDNIVITSPIYTEGPKEFDGRWWRNNKSNPMNICGHFFVFKKESRIPIPEEMKIWYGDNWFYENIIRNKGIEMPIVDSKIHHYGSKTVKTKNPLIEAIIAKDEIIWKTYCKDYFNKLNDAIVRASSQIQE